MDNKTKSLIDSILKDFDISENVMKVLKYEINRSDLNQENIKNYDEVEEKINEIYLKVNKFLISINIGKQKRLFL